MTFKVKCMDYSFHNQCNCFPYVFYILFKYCLNSIMFLCMFIGFVFPTQCFYLFLGGVFLIFTQNEIIINY